MVTADGKTYRKEAGLVQARADRKPMRYTPSGWQDISIAWERNMQLIGVERNFSLPIKFVLDGADITRYLAYNKSIEEIVYLLIQKKKLFISDTKYYFYYDYFYKGELDWSTVEDAESEVAINIMQGALSKKLKANKGTEYEIPLEDDTSIWVKLETQELHESATMQVVTELPIAKSVYADSFMVPLIVLGEEAIKPGAGFVSEQVESTGNSVTYVNTSSNYFAIANESNRADMDIYLEGVLKVKASVNSLPFGLTFRFMKSSMTTGNQNLYNVGGVAPVVGTVHEIPIDLDVTLAPGEKLFLRAAITGGITGAVDLVFEFQEGSQFVATYKYRHPATFIKAKHPKILYYDLMGKVTGDRTAGTSEVLENYANLVLTTGDAIRGITGSKFQTKLDDFVTSFNAILNIGLGIEADKIVLERKEYFLKNENVIPLGTVRNCKQKRYTEAMANTIIIGYPDQTYDNVNGKQEFNTTHRYSSPLERVVKELDLTSVYRADSMGITFLQINLEGKTTTDNSADKDIFVLNVDLTSPEVDAEHGVYYLLKRKTYDVITGIQSPETAFNIEELTPARMADKHKAWFNSIFYDFPGLKLTFQTTDKNRELYTQAGSEVFDEDADIVIGTNRLFKPWTFDFEPETPEDLVETMEDNPNRCFSFVHPRNGLTYKGFNLKVAIAPNTLQEQAFLLLSTPDNDLKTLGT